MMDKKHDRQQLDELSHLLDTWGGAPTRWPVRVRAQIAALSAGPEAARLLAEARAFDILLERAGEAPAPIRAARATDLADRIVAAALAAPLPATVPAKYSGEVIELPRRARPAAVAPGIGGTWSTAGLLAASLLVGIYLGGSVNMLPVLQEVAEVVGMSTVVDPAVAVLGEDLAEDDGL